MSVTKTTLERQISSCVKKSSSFLILLIEKNSLLDGEYSFEDQTHLKDQLVHIVNLRTYFAKVILSDVILGIFQESELIWEQPYFLLDFISLLKDRVAYQIENDDMDIEVPQEYFNLVSKHFDLINNGDDVETFASVSTASPASDATVTYDSDEVADWAQEEY